MGYTNAGKSTLLNRLTDAGVLVEDRLFATLDATTRRLSLPGERPCCSPTLSVSCASCPTSWWRRSARRWTS
ncbi:MAG: 50S ribosome-binding GTPase [Microthrixaceae bacterium]|nr:50S ribosome-binding GTPase [Microthrixaceae bacterium]